MSKQKQKIYTKQGDKGYTSLLGGTQVQKSDCRIEAYGTLDELNSFIGLVRDFALAPEIKDILIQIQEHIFIAEAIIAADSINSLKSLPKISEKDIERIEQEIDRINEQLPVLKNFIIPGGHPVVSYCHIVRTICRRAERKIVAIKSETPECYIVIKYINRLSDYFFVLARFIAKELGVEQQTWKP